MTEDQPTIIICTPDQLRREMIAEYWRCLVPTSEIARVMEIDEAEVCRVVDEIEAVKRGECGR